MSDSILDVSASNEADNSTSVGVADKTGTGETGKSNLPAWTAQLPKPVLEKLTPDKVPYKNLGEVWTKLQTLEQEVGKGIRVPGKDATAEERDRYRKAIGVPDSPDGYAFERPTNLPEGVRYDESVEQWFKEEARNLDLPVEAARKLYSDFNKMDLQRTQSEIQKAKRSQFEAMEERKQAIRDGMSALQRVWGNRYEENLSAVQMIAKNSSLVPPTWIERIKKDGLDNDPDTIILLHNLYRATKEDSKIGIPREAGDVEESDVDPKTGRHMIRHPKTRARYKGSLEE